MSKLDPLRQAVAVSPDNVPLLLLLAHACLDEWSLDEAKSTLVSSHPLVEFMGPVELNPRGFLARELEGIFAANLGKCLLKRVFARTDFRGHAPAHFTEVSHFLGAGSYTSEVEYVGYGR